MSMSNDDNSSLTMALINAIADQEDVDPTELNPPLFDVLDPEALDSLFRTTEGGVTFTYLEYAVAVQSDGTVELRERDTNGDISCH